MMSDYGSTPPPPPPPPGEGEGPGQHQGMPSSMPGMPSYESAPAAAPVERPASIAQAVKLMYVGAALSLLGIIVTLLEKDAIRDSVRNSSAGKTMTPDQLDSAVTLGMVSGIVAGLIGVGLWLWMASANGKGRKWARIVATVFFAFSVLNFLGSFLQPTPALSRILGIVMLALGAYILYLLYRPESTQYYEAQSAPHI
jgi:hypothetical protein